MIHLKCHRMRMFIGVGLLILSGMQQPVFAQNAAQEVPLVIAGKMPLYPLTALHVGVQGVVKVRVTTDGKKVTSLEAESGPAMLVKFAEENIRTWEFTDHKPTTFVTTFEYVIEEPAECYFSNSVAVLKLPLEVRISTKGLKTCDPAAEIKPHP
jgi:hypothetical protein